MCNLETWTKQVDMSMSPYYKFSIYIFLGVRMRNEE